MRISANAQQTEYSGRSEPASWLPAQKRLDPSMIRPTMKQEGDKPPKSRRLMWVSLPYKLSTRQLHDSPEQKPAAVQECG